VTAEDNIDRALKLMMRRAPEPARMRFSREGGRGVGVTRLSDSELKRDLQICVLLSDPDRTPRERTTREQRGRLWEYAHILRDEIARRRQQAEWARQSGDGQAAL
jgi:hypothetical protein